MVQWVVVLLTWVVVPDAPDNKARATGPVFVAAIE